MTEETITINIECKGAFLESFKCTLSVDQEIPKSKAHPERVGYSLENIKDMINEEDCLKKNKELKEHLDKRKFTPTTSTTKLDETAVQHCKYLCDGPKEHPKAIKLKGYHFTPEDRIENVMTYQCILPVLDVKGDLIKAIMTPNKLKPDEEIRRGYRYAPCKSCGEMKPKTSLRTDGLCVDCVKELQDY